MEEKILFGRGPASVRGLLRGTKKGSVKLVTSAGIYIELEGDIVLLCRKQWGIVPIGICLSNYSELLKWRPEPGQPVSVQNGAITLPAGSIRLDLTVSGQAEKGGQVQTTALDNLVRALISEEKHTGLAPIALRLLSDRKTQKMPNVYCDIAIPGLTALANGVAAGNGQQITQGLDILLGLGPGLTPSGDDVVCGILYVLLRSDARRQAGIRMLADAVQRDAPVKTSTISAAYLTAIAKGEDYERMQDVWLEMTGSGISRVNRLLEVGSCSGGDMLLGMLVAGKLLALMEEMEYGRPYSAGSLG